MEIEQLFAEVRDAIRKAAIQISAAILMAGESGMDTKYRIRYS